MATKKPHAFTEFVAQIWNGEKLVSQAEGLSIDAAREIAQSEHVIGHTGRIIAMPMADYDYWEVYPPDGKVRIGSFRETTIVHYAA